MLHVIVSFLSFLSLCLLFFLSWQTVWWTFILWCIGWIR